MEGKLLNVNRFMSNFATKLVSGFIPVIVYKYAPSNKMFLALLTLIVQYFTNLMFNIALKKYLIKKPQLFLFLRIIPIAIYQILLLFVADYTLFCVIGIGIAFALSYTFKNIPNEVLFAYINASKKRGTGHQLAYAKFIDQLALQQS